MNERANWIQRQRYRSELLRGGLSEFGNGEVVEQAEDGFVDAAERLAHGAAIGLVAGAVIGKTVSENNGAVDGADDFERGDTRGVAGKFITAIGAGERLDDAGFGQLLHDLGEKGDGEMVSVGNLARAGGRVGSGSEVAEGDQPVIGLFG